MIMNIVSSLVEPESGVGGVGGVGGCGGATLV